MITAITPSMEPPLISGGNLTMPSRPLWMVTCKAIENFNGAITTYSRNVKRWRSGTMVVRWVSAAIVEVEKKFRRVHGWQDITKVVSALGHLEAKEEASTERVA